MGHRRRTHDDQWPLHSGRCPGPGGARGGPRWTVGASALAIGEKMHAPPLTTEFLEACNRLPLPLINIPYPLPFIAIARSVAESSLLEESRRLRQTARVYDLLRTAGASEDHWQSLVQRLATELDADLFVVDRRCLHPWHPDGQALPVFLAEEWAPLSGQVSLAGKNFQWHRIRGQACAHHGHSRRTPTRSWWCCPTANRTRTPSCSCTRQPCWDCSFRASFCRWKAATGWRESSCCRPWTAAWERPRWRAG